ncbi:E2/UBC family protein [Sphingomonas sp. ASV193]|uniref:E2/UBC family protein n=1 Tax=Sphingomonas sp. ASV193 TaxID=3144405 RepID=UPI0032E92BBC
MGPLETQLAQLRERFGDVAADRLPSGQTLVTVPSVRIPPGWNKERSAIRFMVPAGYPFAALDCFWADPDLMLAGGRMPQNTASNPVPEVGTPGLWFSWHLSQAWNPNRDTLSSWMNTIIERLRKLQ